MRYAMALFVLVAACGGGSDWTATAESACNEFVGIDLDYTAGDITAEDAGDQIVELMSAASDDDNETLYDELEALWNGTFEDWETAANRFDDWCRSNRP